jgi:hypothetical protein
MRAPSSVIFDVVATKITCPMLGLSTSMARWAAHTPVGGKWIFTTTGRVQTRTLPERCRENSWRGGRDAATPPICQRHRTRSSDRVAVLHDPLQSAAAPAPP